MSRMLVPVDPTQPARTRSAIDEVVRLKGLQAVSVHLLRVQAPVSGHVAMFFDATELHELQQSVDTDELLYAQGLLDHAGVPYVSSVRLGHSAPTIIAAARELGCDRIIFGQVDSSLAGRIFGSLAHQVRQLLGASGDLQVIGS